jgi:phage shock protein E
LKPNPFVRKLFEKKDMIIDKIKKLLGISDEAVADYKSLVHGGAQIIDVRTPVEFSAGHIPNSINIPLNHLAKKITRVGKDRQIILCCRSGMRSASAKSMLLSMGYSHVHDGGSWSSLMKRINK